MISPNQPVYNTVIFYIIIVCIILLIKPNFMYCHKTKQFKAFGCNKNQTLTSFPVVCISTGIVLYMIFLWIKIMNQYLNK